VSLAVAVTAGVMGGSIVAANADEKPTSPVAAVDSAPSLDAQDDPISDEGQPVDANTPSDVSTLALPRACKNTAPTTVGLSIRAYCYWLQRGLPKTRQNVPILWATWTGGGQFFNRDHNLPTGGNHMYMEYDMKPHTPGGGRDANRIVVDIIGGLKYYTTDHYRTFHEFAV
jgi:hypothetical protein